MDIINNHGENIGFNDVAISNEKSVTIKRINKLPPMLSHSYLI